MSCKILPPDKAADAAPMDWSRAPGTAIPATPAARRLPDAVVGADDEAGGRQRLQQAEAEAKRRADAEYQRGFAEGESSGAKKAAAKLEPVMERLARSISDLAGYRDRFRRESEQDLVMVSIAIARRILRRELVIDPEAILGLVKVAMDKVSLRETHRIRVHPEDVAVVRTHLQRIQAPQAIEVEGDAGLERGGVIFETARGSLDASMETQLRVIERGFAEIAGRPQ